MTETSAGIPDSYIRETTIDMPRERLVEWIVSIERELTNARATIDAQAAELAVLQWENERLKQAVQMFRDARCRYGLEEVHHSVWDWQRFERWIDDALTATTSREGEQA